MNVSKFPPPAPDQGEVVDSVKAYPTKVATDNLEDLLEGMVDLKEWREEIITLVKGREHAAKVEVLKELLGLMETDLNGPPFLPKGRIDEKLSQLEQHE